jgi:hypothetical protein
MLAYAPYKRLTEDDQIAKQLLGEKAIRGIKRLGCVPIEDFPSMYDGITW